MAYPYLDFAGVEEQTALYLNNATVAFGAGNYEAVLLNLGKYLTLHPNPSDEQFQHLYQAYQHVFGNLKDRWNQSKQREKYGLPEVRSMGWMECSEIEDEILALCKAVLRLLNLSLIPPLNGVVNFLLLRGKIDEDLTQIWNCLLSRESFTTAYYLATRNNQNLTDPLTRNAAIGFANYLLKQGERARARDLFHQVREANIPLELPEVENGLIRCDTPQVEELNVRLAKALTLFAEAGETLTLREDELRDIQAFKIEGEMLIDMLGSCEAAN